MIVLKHLSKTFDIDPYRLRGILRKQFGKHPRWRWESEKDPEYKAIVKFLKQHTKETLNGKGKD